jgi:hypothetical protein
MAAAVWPTVSCAPPKLATASSSANTQGLRLVHFPAQPEPFMTQNTP